LLLNCNRIQQKKGWHTHTHTHARARTHTHTRTRTHAHTHTYADGRMSCGIVRYSA